MRPSAAAFAGIWLAALLAAPLLLSAPSPAAAASAVCRQLEAELASLGSAREAAPPQRFQRAIREQRRQLQIARRQAQQRGCSGSFSFFGGPGGDVCARLRSSISAMQSNLATLESHGFRQENRARAGIERARILSRIEANRCREKPERTATFDHVRRLAPPIEKVARRDEELLNRLFKGNLRHSQPSERGILEPDSGNIVSGGTFRTLCVRTCDGYFFPVSFSTTEQFFARDEEICQAMCPGVEVRLYSHKAGDEESEDMVSLTGEPYSALATAWQYKDPAFERSRACACNAPKDFTLLGGDDKAQEKPADPMDLAPLPVSRPDPALDPESAANAAGGLTAQAVRNLVTSAPASTAGISGEPPKVRVVGPAFLPDPSGALDLKAPGRTTVR